MAQTARRVVFPERNVVKIEELDPGEPGEGPVLVETEAKLIRTGTELAYSGRVVAVGPGVTDFKAGDRVYGSTPHATRMVCRQQDCYPIPENVEFEEATFSSLAAVSMNGLRLGGPQLGEVIVVMGMGIVGQLGLQLAALTGPRLLVAMDLSDRRLEMASALGADETINPASCDPVERLRELTGGEMADLVLDATGAPQAFPLAMELGGPRARVVLVGSTRGEVKEVDVYTQIHCKGLVIIGAHAATHPAAETPYNKWTRPRNRQLAIELVSRGRLKVKPMITHRFPFDRAVEAFDLLVKDRTQAIGVILEYRGSG